MTNETTIKNEQFVCDSVNHKRNWWQLFAIIFMSGGLLAIIVGQILTFLMWLFHQQIIQLSLQSITNLLFYISIPLLFIGACCLDKVEEKRRAKNIDLNS